ncbi:unnamed protein product, partial [Phaeothamnion confervicola]
SAASFYFLFLGKQHCCGRTTGKKKKEEKKDKRGKRKMAGPREALAATVAEVVNALPDSELVKELGAAIASFLEAKITDPLLVALVQLARCVGRTAKNSRLKVDALHALRLGIELGRPAAEPEFLEKGVPAFLDASRADVPKVRVAACGVLEAWLLGDPPHATATLLASTPDAWQLLALAQDDFPQVRAAADAALPVQSLPEPVVATLADRIIQTLGSGEGGSAFQTACRCFRALASRASRDEQGAAADAVLALLTECTIQPPDEPHWQGRRHLGSLDAADSAEASALLRGMGAAAACSDWAARLAQDAVASFGAACDAVEQAAALLAATDESEGSHCGFAVRKWREAYCLLVLLELCVAGGAATIQDNATPPPLEQKAPTAGAEAKEEVALPGEPAGAAAARALWSALDAMLTRTPPTHVRLHQLDRPSEGAAQCAKWLSAAACILLRLTAVAAALVPQDAAAAAPAAAASTAAPAAATMPARGGGGSGSEAEAQLEEERDCQLLLSLLAFEDGATAADAPSTWIAGPLSPAQQQQLQEQRQSQQVAGGGGTTTAAAAATAAAGESDDLLRPVSWELSAWQDGAARPMLTTQWAADAATRSLAAAAIGVVCARLCPPSAAAIAAANAPQMAEKQAGTAKATAAAVSGADPVAGLMAADAPALAVALRRRIRRSGWRDGDGVAWKHVVVRLVRRGRFPDFSFSTFSRRRKQQRTGFGPGSAGLGDGGCFGGSGSSSFGGIGGGGSGGSGRGGGGGSDVLTDLLAVVLPLADDYDPTHQALGLSALRHLLAQLTPTELAWHRPVLAGMLQRVLRGAQEPAVVWLAAACARVVLDALPRAERPTAAAEARTLALQCAQRCGGSATAAGR